MLWICCICQAFFVCSCVLLEPGFDYLHALAPYQPLNMKVCPSCQGLLCRTGYHWLYLCSRPITRRFTSPLTRASTSLSPTSSWKNLPYVRATHLSRDCHTHFDNVMWLFRGGWVGLCSHIVYSHLLTTCQRRPNLRRRQRACSRWVWLVTRMRNVYKSVVVVNKVYCPLSLTTPIHLPGCLPLTTPTHIFICFCVGDDISWDSPRKCGLCSPQLKVSEDSACTRGKANLHWQPWLSKLAGTRQKHFP